MKRHMTILLTVLAVGAGSAPRGVQAASLGIPAAVYPAGAQISYLPTLSNHQMDCLWGFFCEGHVPLFHFYQQDQLHRVGGWGQFAGVHRHGRMVMSFELFASYYQSGTDVDGTHWSQEAFADLIQATHERGYTRLSRQPHLLPATANGGSIAAVQHVGVSELILMACWSDTLEVEAMVVVDHASASSRHVAVRDIVDQVLQAASAKGEMR